jgi:hypothetical protein
MSIPASRAQSRSFIVGFYNIKGHDIWGPRTMHRTAFSETDKASTNNVNVNTTTSTMALHWRLDHVSVEYSFDNPVSPHWGCTFQGGEAGSLLENIGVSTHKSFAETWIPPNASKFEGPHLFGLENHFCTDCQGCYSNFLQCAVKENVTVTNDDNDDTNKCSNGKHIVYGG